MNMAVLSRGVSAGVLVVLLPLAGVWAAGLPLARYLEFPPRSQYLEPAPFSWPVFIGLAVVEVILLVLFLRWCRPIAGSSAWCFPVWGWLGFAAMAAIWILAWTRFEWFAPLQAHTFTPLWLSYLVVVNALTYRRAGQCLLIRELRRLPALFAASATFWWFFEYLNRFVQNWRYLGIDAFSPPQYFAFATLAYSTVLPAVISTEECLRVHGCWRQADKRHLPAPSAGWLRLVFAASAMGLASVGVLPTVLFPLLWLAPLGILVWFHGSARSFETLPTIGTLCRLAAGALVCGFFWELWNWHSLAKWVYNVSYVGRFRLFEMPVLGYFGYLPFGWECGLIAASLPRGRDNPLRR